MKRVFLIFLLLTFSLLLASCGECEHIDENNDGVCDLCEWNYDHTHTYEENWSHDSTEHWHVVTCGHSVSDKALHDDKNNDAVCDGCGWDYDHTHTYDDAWSHDSESHWYAPECDHSIDAKDKAPHTDANNDGICEGCLWNYDHEHTYEESWSRNDESHWHKVTCTHSVDVKDKANHTDSNNDGLCDGCGWNYEHEHTYDDGWAYDESNHWHVSTCPHEIEIADKAPHVDTNTDGECDVCGHGKLIEDENGEIELPEVDF